MAGKCKANQTSVCKMCDMVCSKAGPLEPTNAEWGMSFGCCWCRLEGDALLHCALENLNAAVLSDAKAAASGSADSSDPPTSPVTPLQPDLADLFEAAGLDNPLEKARGQAPVLQLSCPHD